MLSHGWSPFTSCIQGKKYDFIEVIEYRISAIRSRGF